MKDQNSKKILVQNLTALIKRYNANTEKYNKIVSLLEEKIPKGTVAAIWGLNKPLQFLDEIDLLVFTQAFYEATNEKDVDPHKFFTDNEFNEGLHKIVDVTLAKDYIVLKNVEKISLEGLGDIYKVPFISCYDIADAFNNNITIYNQEAQREPIKKVVLGEEIKLPKIFDDKVQKISSQLLDGTYVPDEITWNIVKTGKEKVYYDKDKRELTIHKVTGSTTDIVDGANRTYASLTAIQKAKEKNETIKSGFSLMVTNFTVKKSYEYILQKNEQTPLSSERVKVFELTKFMKIAKEINIYENAETNILWQKLGDSIGDLKLTNKLSTLETFADGIEANFKDVLDSDNPSIYSDLLDYQVNFFNQFFGAHFDKLKNVEQTRKDTVLLDNNMFLVYIHISKKLYEYEKQPRIWRNKVKEVATGIDFSKENKDWESLKTTGTKNKKAMEKLMSYVDAKINEIFNEDTENNKQELINS